MVQMAILIAIMLVFAFTPIGYLKVGFIEITFMVLPVAIGAIICGPTGGAVLGGIFGITSFIQCFGMSPFGTFLLGLNPWLTFVTCLIPRILCGWLSGLLFKALNKIDKTKVGVLFRGESFDCFVEYAVLYAFYRCVFLEGRRLYRENG